MDKRDSWELLAVPSGFDKADYCNFMQDIEGVLTISFMSIHGVKYMVIFEDGVYSHRKTINKARDRTLVNARSSETNYLRGKWAFRAIDSEYLDWIREESGDFLNSLRLRHYVFLTKEELIEVLSLSSPKFMLDK